MTTRVPEIAMLRKRIGSAKVVFHSNAWNEVYSEVLGVVATPASELVRRVALPCLRKAGPCVWLAVVWSDGRTVAKVSDAYNKIDDKADLVFALENAGVPESFTPWSVVLTAESDHTLIKGKNFKSMILKPANGYGGEGIIIVNSVVEAMTHIRASEALAAELPFACEAAPQRFVLQEFIHSITVDNQPFHLRTYAARVDGKSYVYIANHEVRVAKPENFITNGLAGADRRLLSQLFDPSLGDRLAAFVASICLTLVPDCNDTREFIEKVDDHANEDDEEKLALVNNEDCFAVAGIDIILDSEDNMLKLLEFNVNPACPKKIEVSELFWNHLCRFASALLSLTLHQYHPDFRLASELLHAS